MFNNLKILTFVFFTILLLPACQQMPGSDSQTTSFRMELPKATTVKDTVLSNTATSGDIEDTVEGLKSVQKEGSISDNTIYKTRVNPNTVQTKTPEENASPENKTSNSSAPTLKLSKTSYNANEQIEVTYNNMATNIKDWIGIFKANDKDKNYLKYEYTNGSKSGKLSFEGMPSGDYEVRAYFDDSYKVEAKASFKVQGNSTSQITAVKPVTPSTKPVSTTSTKPVTTTSTKPVTAPSTDGKPITVNQSEYDSIKPITIGWASNRPWKDMDADGDFDVIMYTDGKIREQALEHAAKELETGSFGRIDVTFIRGNKAQADADSYAGFMHTESLSYWGSSGYGPDARLRMTTQWAYTDANFLHEMMHCVGVTLDAKANNGDSIMDYNYRKAGLSLYDKGLLKHMYMKAKPGSNNRTTIVDKAWH